jgi:hypothetical protein
LSQDVYNSIQEKSPVQKYPEQKIFNAHIDWLKSLEDLVDGITSHSDLFTAMEKNASEDLLELQKNKINGDFLKLS